MGVTYLDISKEELEKLYKEFGTQQKIADYLKVPVYKIKQLVGKYQIYQSQASFTKIKKAKENFINKAILRHGECYEYTKVNYINSDTSVQIFCKRCNKYFWQIPNSHLTGSGCPYCQNIRNSEKQRKSIEQFIQDAKKIHGDLYDYSKTIYHGSKKPCIIKCNKCGNEFIQSPMKHLCKHGCPICNCHQQHIKQRKTKEQFIIDSQKVHGDKYDYSEVEYIGNAKEVKIKCKKCNDYFWQRPSSHLTGRGCPKCGIEIQRKKQSKTNQDFIKQARLIHPNNEYDYTETEYKTARKKIKIKCNKCNNYFMQTPMKHLNGQGCPHCVISKGEIKIKNWLIKNKIKFVFQHKFEDCKYKTYLFFDFYLPEYNACIEYQGQQHYIPVYFTKKQTQEETEKALKINQIRDRIKREYCKAHGIILLEIRYDEKVDIKLENFFKNLTKKYNSNI